MQQPGVSPDVREYIEAIPAEYRPLFDRIHRLIVRDHPDVSVVLSYRMPTYVRGRNRLHVGVWKHGVSLYGRWPERDEFATRHPELASGRGTLRLRPADAETICDDDLTVLIRGALGT